MNLVILTKSSKHGKYCVAGVDVSNGKWVRLTTDDVDTDGAVSDEDLECIDGRIAQVMDEIEIAVEPDPDPIQPENMKIIPRNGLPRLIQQYNLNMVLQIHPAERERYVFFTSYPTVRPEHIIDHHDSKSLMLIEVSDLVVGKRNYKTVASFDFAGNRYTDIHVTDPETYPRIDNGDVIRSLDAFLVVSLGKPYISRATGERVCYKFVAKIFAWGDQ